MHASICTANASLISNRSISSSEQPALATTRRMASTGAVNKSCGSAPEVADATIRASGRRPNRAAADSDPTTTAAAPSLIMRRIARGDGAACPKGRCKVRQLPRDPCRLAGLRRRETILLSVPRRRRPGRSPRRMPRRRRPQPPGDDFRARTDPGRRAKCQPAQRASAISPIDCLLNGQVSPSCIMESTSWRSPSAGRVARQHPTGLAHAFHSARDDQIDVAAAHALRREHHGFQSRAAHFVDRQCRDRRRQAGPQCRLPRRRLADAGRQHVAEDNFVDVAWFAAGSSHGLAHGDGAEVSDRHGRKAIRETCRSACGTRKV